MKKVLEITRNLLLIASVTFASVGILAFVMFITGQYWFPNLDMIAGSVFLTVGAIALLIAGKLTDKINK